MPHLDHDQLVLLALGDEPLTGDAAAHLDTCVDCASELATLRHVAGLGGETEELHDLPAPPEHVWAAIATQALGAAPTPTRPDVGGRHARPDGGSGASGPDAGPPTSAGPGSHVSGSNGPNSTAPGSTRPGSTGPGSTGPGSAGPGRRGARGLVRLALVALIGAVLGVGATLGVQALRDNDSSSAPAVVASGTFAPKAPAAQGASGSAQVVDTGHGKQLRITVAGMPAPQGVYEAWLYDPGTGRMIPLGGMSTSGGDYDVSGYDLTAFTVVDVSAQTYDGAEGHGQSMLQAPLS